MLSGSPPPGLNFPSLAFKIGAERGVGLLGDAEGL